MTTLLWCPQRIRCVAMLMLVLLAGCSVPERASVAQAPLPTHATSSIPLTATPLPATIAPTRPTQTPTPTAVTETPEPTETFSPIELSPTLLPLPAGTLGQTVRQLGDNAFLYTSLQRIITLASSDGARQFQVGANVCHDYDYTYEPSARWSFDGRYVALSCLISDDGDEKVAVVNTTSGKMRRFATRNESFGIIWSPVNEQYVLMRAEGQNTEPEGRCSYTIIDAGTGKQTPLMAKDFVACSYIVSLSWSPDGKQVAFVGQQPDDGLVALYLINADGSQLRRFAISAQGPTLSGAISVAWNPDGKTLVVESSYTSQDLQVDAVTGSVQILSSNGPLRWSPDGRWYLAAQERDWSLHKADGTLVRSITPPAGRIDVEVAWLPDSQRFVIAGERPERVEVIVADLSGQETIIAGYPQAVIEQPPLVIAPDGSLLALMITVRQLVILDLHGHERGRMRGRFQNWWPGK